MTDTFRVDYDPTPILRAWKKHQDEVIDELGKALVGAAETVMLLSKSVYVPVITGNLRSTGTVGPVQISVGVISVEMSYGGPAAPYAEAVHDAPPEWGQGKRHYLLIPFMEVSRNLDQRIRQHMASIYR